MKKSDIERVNKLQDEDLGLWLEAYDEACDELSAKPNMFCVCGRLCIPANQCRVGFHESNRRKWDDEVKLRTIQILEDRMSSKDIKSEDEESSNLFQAELNKSNWFPEVSVRMHVYIPINPDIEMNDSEVDARVDTLIDLLEEKGYGYQVYEKSYK